MPGFGARLLRLQTPPPAYSDLDRTAVVTFHARLAMRTPI
jgi:hypothetical protein